MRNPPHEESSQETILIGSENTAGHGLLMVVGRVISPPRTELLKLRPALTQGERRVFELLDASLPDEWEIYVQPHLNGMRPDFIVLNPSAGIGVIEVKDWNLRAIHYKRSTDKDGAVRLIGSKENGETFRERDPLTQARIYRDEIFELYCPRLEERMGYAAISVGVVFPNAAEIELKALFPKDSMKEREYVVGNETLSKGKASELDSSFKYSTSKIMSEAMAEDLRGWLREPDSVAEQREPLRLDSVQRALVVDRTSSGYRRIRGPAGSGKSIVLAARASRLAAEGKKVLVSTFNITMLHYLRDLSARSGEGHPNRITWLNFHAWCKRVANEVDLVDEYNAIWRKHHQGDSDAFSEVADLLIQNSDALSRIESCTYDAILVDEGQDFQPLWWQALRVALRPEGEMLLVADATQDIYKTARLWTNEAMTGAGFTGRWNELATSYRLPASLTEIAKNFAVQFLPLETRMLPIAPSAQGEFEYDRCELKWVQVESDKVSSRSVVELDALIAGEEGPERTRCTDTVIG